MDLKPTRIFPLGEAAVTVEFGSEMSPLLNEAAIAVADHFTANPFDGFVEAVPAIASATVFYRPSLIDRRRSPHATAFDIVAALVLKAVDSIPIGARGDERLITVPVSFARKDALDIAAMEEHTGLAADAIIDIFLAGSYRVYMLGFLPGFPYLGTVDERIAMPRHASPRMSVPKGSVGIAGRQTGIYPSDSPGGWQIIGRTDLGLFDPGRTPPCLFAPGDRVRFVRA